MRRISIERTKKGFPAIWESGGGFTNTGEAQIIAGKDGKPKRPIYIRKKGHLANSEHALLPIEVGDYVIKAYHSRGKFDVVVYKIISIEEEKYTAYGNAVENLSEKEFIN